MCVKFQTIDLGRTSWPYTLLPQSSIGSSLPGHEHQPHVIMYNNAGGHLSLMHGERHWCTSERVMALSPDKPQDLYTGSGCEEQSLIMRRTHLYTMYQLDREEPKMSDSTSKDPTDLDDVNQMCHNKDAESGVTVSNAPYCRRIGE